MASKNVRSYDNKQDDVAAMKLWKFIFVGLLVIAWALTIPVAAQQPGNPPLEGHAIAKLPINTQLQFFGNIARPEDAAKWQMRFQIQFLFPK